MSTPKEHSGHQLTTTGAGAAANPRRGRLGAMITDNDERLWYITKFGGSKFPTDKLKILVEVRRAFQKNPDLQLSADREVQYREATMAAAEFLEDRHPEAIRLYAQVQNKEKANPLSHWLLGIAIALALALGSNAYRTLIGTPIDKMKQTRSAYSEEAQRLSQPGEEITAGELASALSRMCEHTMVYRDLASQLRALLPFEQPTPESGDPRTERLGVCGLLARAQVRLVVHRGATDAPAANNGNVVKAALDLAQSTLEAPAESSREHGFESGDLVAAALREEFAPPQDRAVRLEAELYDSILALAVLPMLYALLGALTSAVRSANSEFKSMTLTRNDSVHLRARVLLGMVGGATIGIVFRADTLDGAAGLTVLGLAFAVGYAVDLFFNLLDGVKLSLGGSSKPAPQHR